MNADQKEKAVELLQQWNADLENSGHNMAALLQELIDAPEVEPVAKVTGYYGGYLSISTIDGRVLPAGTALYLAPPAPSAPDEELQAAFDRGLKAGNEQKEAQQVEIHRLHDLLAATTTQAEAPADVARDAARLEFLLPVVTGDDSHDAIMRTTAIAAALLQGFSGRAAIDAAIERDKLKGQS